MGLLLALGGGNTAGAPASSPLDLPAAAGIRLEGGGGSVAAAGDVNGDGYGDVVAGAPFDRPDEAGGGAGGAFVAFGGPGLRIANVMMGGAQGIRIFGAKGGDGAGKRVSGAGDFNGDGLADVLVTAPNAEEFSRRIPGQRLRQGTRGAAYLVFGSRSNQDVDLGDLGPRGLIVKGTGGGAAAGVGDFNGDGRDDIAVGDQDSFPGGDGGAHVIFGGPISGVLDAARLGSRGVTLRGAPGDLGSGFAVAGAGDVNGDGLGDVVLGAPIGVGSPVSDDEREPVGPGIAYVVFGRRTTAQVRLDRLGEGGLRIGPPKTFGYLGASVAGAGDVNGDGLSDVIVGAPAYPIDFRGGRRGPGTAFVVFGRRSGGRIKVETLGTAGYEIRGDLSAPGAGTSVAGAGDINADGLGDVLVGAADFETQDPVHERSTMAYAVFGRRGAGVVRLADVSGGAGEPGLAMRGLLGDSLGRAVAAADIDGDGRPELLLGAGSSCLGGARRVNIAGELWGAEPLRRGTVYALSPNAASGAGTGIVVGMDGADVLTGGPGDERIAGRAGDDTVAGAGGGDCLFGDGGADSIRGGGGGDALFGGAGADDLGGEAGDDSLHSNSGNDRVAGGTGQDGIDGGSGDDRLSGGPGPDLVEDAQGDDLLTGGPGEDFLRDGAGRNVLRGGDGSDGLWGGSGRDRLYGGAGGDVLSGDLAAENPETGGADRLDGGPGPDRLIGEGGHDRLRGGQGNDIVEAHDGRRDLVNCGPGRDRAYVDRVDGVVGCETVRYARAPLGH